MKKIYFAPETNIYEVETQQILAGSLKGLGASGGTVKTIDEELESGVGGESRGYDFWDDEEEY